MSNEWERSFGKRMKEFASKRNPRPGETAVSIKIRVESGCYHREHSPRAYEIIDSYLVELDSGAVDFVFEEHESGPEILVYLALTTAGLSLSKSIIDLITVIIKARSEGLRKGDRPNAPLKLIVRHIRRKGEVVEKEVLEVQSNGSIRRNEMAQLIEKALKSLLEDGTSKVE